MLRKIKHFYNGLVISFNHERFKTICLLCFFAAFISSFDVYNKLQYEEAVLYYINTNLYQTLLFLILFVSSAYIISNFDRGIQRNIRYRTKEEYLKELFKTITICNLIIYVIYSLFGLIIITIKYISKLTFISFDYYNIPYFLYNFYNYFKYFIIINLIVLICLSFYKFTKKYIGASLFALLITIKAGYAYNLDLISSYKSFKVFYGYYLFPMQYGSFALDINMLMVEIIILYIIYYIIRFLNIKYNKISLDI